MTKRGRAPAAKAEPPELCNGCGACCNPVSLPHSRHEIEQLLPSQVDAYTKWWMLNILHPMSRREGLELAPWQRTNNAVPVINGEPQPWWSHFYRCDWFDPVTRRCTEHERRPPVCRGYPRYDQPRVHPQAALPPMCGYRAEQGKTVAPMPAEWQPVLLGKKP